MIGIQACLPMTRFLPAVVRRILPLMWEYLNETSSNKILFYDVSRLLQQCVDDATELWERLGADDALSVDLKHWSGYNT